MTLLLGQRYSEDLEESASLRTRCRSLEKELQLYLITWFPCSKYSKPKTLFESEDSYYIDLSDSQKEGVKKTCFCSITMKAAIFPFVYSHDKKPTSMIQLPNSYNLQYRHVCQYIMRRKQNGTTSTFHRIRCAYVTRTIHLLQIRQCD